jgi:hypothetical protein
MLSADEVHATGALCYADAEALADLWNRAYPVMRAISTRYIAAYRKRIESEEWNVDPASHMAEFLRERTPPESTFRRKLKNAERVRQEIGQLDRATYKGCTRSPGGFSITGAYMLVRSVLGVSSLGTEGMADVYRLAASLAGAEEKLNAERIARHKEMAGGMA